MKLTKLVALLLCSVFVCLAFAGCGKKDGYTDYDWVPHVEIAMEYDLYIFADGEISDSTEKAQKTVNSKINQYLSEKYNTTVNIKYVSADSVEEYEAALKLLLAAPQTPSAGSKVKGGSIVLITSEALHDELVSAGKLVDLAPFLASKDFGTLNIQIASTLIQAATVTENNASHLYCIPNNHIVGEYEYTVINVEIAEGYYNFSAERELCEMKIVDGIPNVQAQELIDSITDHNVEDVIKVVKGTYSDKADWEKDGYVCNVSKYPEATKSDALKSAFGVIKADDASAPQDYDKRAMEVIYALNSNEEIRNILQYGVEHTHYTLENGIVIPIESSGYNMNLLYTGDVFKAYYSAEWTAAIAESGKNQNKESVYLGK